MSKNREKHCKKDKNQLGEKFFREHGKNKQADRSGKGKTGAQSGKGA